MFTGVNLSRTMMVIRTNVFWKRVNGKTINSTLMMWERACLHCLPSLRLKDGHSKCFLLSMHWEILAHYF